MQSGTLSITGTISQVSGTTLTGGTWDVANSATLNFGTTPNLTASQAAVGLGGPNAVFTQFATVTNDSGSLSLIGGAGYSASGNLTISGNFSLDTGTLQLNNHALTIGSGGSLSLGMANGLTGETQVTNAGTFDYQGGGTMSLAATFNNQNGTISVEAGTLSLAGTGAWTGGTLNANGTAMLNVSGTPTVTGTLTGSGTGHGAAQRHAQRRHQASDVATFNFPGGLLQWQGTIGGSGTLTNASGGFLSENGTGLDRLNTTLRNAGTLTVSGSNPLDLFAATGTLTNAAGGVIEVQAGAAVAGQSASNVVTNLGTLKHSGAGTGTINVRLDNQGGTLQADAGTFSLAGAGTWTGGTLNANGTAMLNVSGIPTVTGTFTGGHGFGAAQRHDRHEHQASDTATFDFPSGLLQWQGIIRRVGHVDERQRRFLERERHRAGPAEHHAHECRHADRLWQQPAQLVRRNGNADERRRGRHRSAGRGRH